jgi:N-acetylglucosamine malate deacetylase 1
MTKEILVIAPHPDDETLGMGGTILKHKGKGDHVHWLIVTNINPDHGWEKDIVVARQSEIQKVAEKYEFSSVHKLDYPTTRLDEYPLRKLINSVSTIINLVKPDTIYLPNRSDIHSDHRITFDMVMACTKSFRYPFIRRLLMYETLSETEFTPALPEKLFAPNIFVDISEYIEQKIEVIQIYKSEVMVAPLPRSLESIRALSLYRGSRIGVKAAEAFQLIFERL